MGITDIEFIRFKVWLIKNYPWVGLHPHQIIMAKQYFLAKHYHETYIFRGKRASGRSFIKKLIISFETHENMMEIRKCLTKQ